MRPVFRLHIRGAVLWIPDIFLSPYSYRAITVYGNAFQHTSDSMTRNSDRRQRRQSIRSKHHIPVPSQGRFGLSCLGFSRPYYPNNDCSLFLRLLRCFNSPRKLPQLAPRMNRMSHSAIRSSQTACVYPRLIAAYHDHDEKIEHV